MRFAKNTQQDTSKVLRLPRKMTMDTSKVLRLPRKLQHIFEKRRKSIAPATQNDFHHVAKHVWMSQSTTPATRNEATTRLKPPKMTTSAELPIGTAIRRTYERLRTVADGSATSSEHTLNPQTPRVKREPLLRIREKCSGFVRWQWDWKSARPVRTRNKHSEICFSLAFESSCRPTGNCLSKSKGVCCWDCGRQATMRGARQPHVAVSRPIQMQFISPPSNSRVNFTCAKMCLPSDRFLVKSPEEWHKYVPSCHENAAEQPLCRLRRRQLPHSCTFLYLHILWQCDHQPTSAQHLIADTTDRRTRLRLSFVLVDAFGIN